MIVKIAPELYSIISNILMPQYFRLKKAGNEEMYCSVNTMIGLELLCDLYEKSVRAKEIDAIEMMPGEIKKRYWDISSRYYSTKKERIKACKAMCMLDELGKL